MSETFFVSDTHFKHKNILKFCPTTRFGRDEVEMTEMMIKVWNEKVRREDTVYHLGDVSFCSGEETAKILNRLNGKIHLIEGNHDRKMLQNKECADRFDSVSPYMNLKMGKQNVILMHYAMRVWDKMHYGSYHLYGHSHNALEHTPYGRSMDVGVDARPNFDMGPWGWEEIDKILKNRVILDHHD